MKLPTFQAQKGTSMASAMTTPARVGNIKERIPVTKRLAATRNVQGELSLGIQKSRRNFAIGALGINIVNEIIKVKETDDNMAMAAATGEYNNRMAQWTTNAKLTSNELNEETGKRRWETFEEDRERESKALKAELRDKHQFSMRSSEATWALKTNGIDAAHQENIAIFQSGKERERAGANYQIAMAETKDPIEAGRLTANAIDANIINEGQGVTNMDSWHTGTLYDSNISTIQSQSFAGLQDLSRKVQLGEGEYAKMTVAQRNSIEAAALEQTKNLHAGAINQAFKNNGISGAQEYLKTVTEGGPETSFASDNLTHGRVVASLGTELSHLERVSVKQEVDMTAAVSLNPLFSKQADPVALDSLSMRKGTKGYKASMENLEEQLLAGYEANPAEFLDNVYGLTARLAYVGDTSDVVTNVLTQDLKSQDPVRMAGAMRFMGTIESQFPSYFKDVPKDLRERADYVEYRLTADNIDTEDKNAMLRLNQDILKIQNMSGEEKTERNQRATNNLSAIKKDIGLEAHITAQAVKAGDIAEGEEIVFSADILNEYETDYKRAYMFTENSNFAGDNGYKTYRRSVGVVDVDGTLTATLNPPESILPKPEGWSQAEHRTYLNSERDKVRIKYNLSRRDTEGYTPISSDDMKYHYNGKNKAGKDVWVVTDLGNVALPYGDSNLQTTFEASHQKLTPKKQNIANTGTVNEKKARQQDIVAQSNVRFVDNGIPNFDVIESGGGDFNSLSGLYDASWLGMSIEEKVLANQAYQSMYNTIKSANDKYGVSDDAMIHWYLFSSGYLRKGKGDTWQKPPGSIDGS